MSGPLASLARWAGELAEVTHVWFVDESSLKTPPTRAEQPRADVIVVAIPGGPDEIDERTWLQLLATPHLRIVLTHDVELPALIAEICSAWEPATAPQVVAPDEPGRSLRSRVRSRASVEVLDARAMPRSRRSLLRVAATDETPHARSTAELVEQIWQLRSREGDVASPALDLAASGCIACGTCVKACPTQVLALQLPRAPGPAHPRAREEAARLDLNYDARGCIGCGTCISLCPVAALSSSGTLAWNAIFSREHHATSEEGSESEVEVLEELTLSRCARCGATFAGAGEFCPACQARMNNPFGSSLPPASWLDRG